MATKKRTTPITTGKNLYAKHGSEGTFASIQCGHRVPGMYVGAALMTVQAAGVSDEIADVLVDVPDMGKVCVTAVRKKCRTGNTPYYLWAAVKAVVVESARSPSRGRRLAS